MLPPDDQLLAAYDRPGPYVRGGMVLSADGAASHDGSSRPLSSPVDRRALRTLRAVADVVLVGAGTARAEGYGAIPLPGPLRAWRQAHGRPPVPPLAVLTRSGDVPDPGPDGLVLRGGPREALEQLHARGLTRVVCEGGPSLLGDLVRQGLLDELCVTLSPLLAGAAPGLLAGPLAEPVPLRLLSLLSEQGVLLLRYAVGARAADDTADGTTDDTSRGAAGDLADRVAGGPADGPAGGPADATSLPA